MTITGSEPQDVLAGPLSSSNKLKLGTFASNSERGATITTIPGALKAEWPESLWAAQLADGMGLEAIVPVSRWKGIGGVTNYNGRNFDTMTWAAGIAASTQYSMVFSTTNVGLINPIVAAKQIATIDHISGGRAALNVVSGWFEPEMRMFGKSLSEHDARYDVTTEFTEILLALWSAGEFEEVTYRGKHLSLIEGYSEPQPLRKPHPPLMNAGVSPRSQEFTARYADIAFIFAMSEDIDDARAQVQTLKDKAAEHGREIQIWTYGYVVSRDTDAEADAYYDYYTVEHGDIEAAENLMRAASMETAMMGAEAWDYYRQRYIAGTAGFELKGSPERVVERLQFVSDMGCDGMLLSWPDWRTDLPYFQQEILPLMEKAGLREPFGAKG